VLTEKKVMQTCILSNQFAACQPHQTAHKIQIQRGLAQIFTQIKSWLKTSVLLIKIAVESQITLHFKFGTNNRVYNFL
jgi:hypothetical protein